MNALPSISLQIGSKRFGIVLLAVFRKHPLDKLGGLSNVQPAGGFEKLLRCQHIHRYIWTGRFIRLQYSESLFIQVTKELPIKGFRPGIKVVVRAKGKAFYMAGQGDLLVTGIFTKHGVLLDWGLAVLLRF
jgi:hypothetical protein